jgi:hypothetical protein
MSDTKHTPGPWKAALIGGEWNIAAPGDKYRVASLQSNIERARAGTVEANARLIAEAPAMFEMLKAMEQLVIAYLDGDVSTKTYDPIVKLAKERNALMARLQDAA